MIHTMLIGGDKGRHFERIRGQAEELGVAIDWHVSGRIHKMPVIPAGCELMLVLISHVGHPLRNKAVQDAKSVGLPIWELPSGGFKSKLHRGLEILGIDPDDDEEEAEDPPPYGAPNRYGFASPTTPIDAVSMEGYWSWDETHWQWIDDPLLTTESVSKRLRGVEDGVKSLDVIFGYLSLLTIASFTSMGAAEGARGRRKGVRKRTRKRGRRR